MYFAAITFNRPGGPQILVGQRLPDELLTPEKIEKLLAKGYITKVDALAEAAVAKEAKREAEKAVPAPVWDFDPALVAADSLETLNMKIQDHAKKRGVEAKSFEDEEDAITFMSSEFKPA